MGLRGVDGGEVRWGIRMHHARIARSEYGYDAWVADVRKNEAMKKEWRRQKCEDSARDARYGFTTKKRRY